MGCSPKLMRYEKFSKAQYRLPKIIKLNGEGKGLVYIGTYHTNNPVDSMFTIIEKEFLSLNPDFVLHEGGNNWPIYADADSTKRISGEPGYTIWLAKKNNIRYASLEPKEQAEYEHLSSLYDYRKVLLMYICRQVDQQQRFHASNPMTIEEFERNMNYFLEMMKGNGIKIPENESTFNFWKGYYESFFGEPLVFGKFDPSVYYPNQFKTELNDINRSSDVFRNQTMVENIMNALDNNNRVLVVVGGGHLIVQEKKVRHDFKQRFR